MLERCENWLGQSYNCNLACGAASPYLDCDSRRHLIHVGVRQGWVLLRVRLQQVDRLLQTCANQLRCQYGWKDGGKRTLGIRRASGVSETVGVGERSPALAPWASSRANRIEPFAPPHFGQSSTSCKREGVAYTVKVLTNRSLNHSKGSRQGQDSVKIKRSRQPRGGHGASHYLVECAGIVPGETDQDRSASLLGDEISEFRAAGLQLVNNRGRFCLWSNKKKQLNRCQATSALHRAVCERKIHRQICQNGTRRR